ncbi:DUF4382 domain-containing protein [Haloprofundus salilacus]|uniref:DUF4382 domain-containing protein n=1 Tax=Haloprofundus salilacus TaxID=2876190 RepID=UPI001CCBE7E0|nr:DUF4382 domain-containing protein [Haloprofundus salilacus]
MVLLAGCAGGISESPMTPTADTSEHATTPTTDTSQSNAVATAATAVSTNAGTVAFYISDEENAIGDFQHLNVTVTRVGFERAAADGGGWVRHDVDAQTIDLTELQGANATLIDKYNLENGTYSKVFIHVSNVNATLQNGEQKRVKLPSKKLQLTNEFTVENGSEVNFVFDITVHKAGNSGKYILKPVISESGTDVPIKPKDDEEQREGLNLELVGNVSQGENVTAEVTRDDKPVANATVVVNEQVVGETDTDGQLSFEVPNDETLKVTVKEGGDQAAREVKFEPTSEQGEKEKKEVTSSLHATFISNVSQGENATLSVTQNDSSVENADVFVNDEEVGTTDANGEITFEIPNADTMTVTVQVGDEELEVEREFESNESR